MKSSWLFMALAVSAFPGSSLVAQEKQQTTEGQIQLGLHKYKMETGSIYEFEVVGDGFYPHVHFSGGVLHHGYRRSVGPKAINTFLGVFIPTKNGECTLIVSPHSRTDVLPEGSTLKYTVTLKTMKLEEKPLLTKDDKITADDPQYVDKRVPVGGTHFKSYDLKLTAEQICIIEMTPKLVFGRLHPRLAVEAKGNQLAQGFGGSNGAVVIFRAPADGEYRIIATGTSHYVDMGDFKLSVRTVKSEK